MSDVWFKNQIAPDGSVEDGCHPDEAQVLQSYLNNHIATPQEAAHAIPRPIVSSDDSGANLNRLWNLLQDALVELSAAHIPALINLLRAIQDLPDPKLTSEPTETPSPKDGFTWKDLPNFGHLWADVYKQDNWRNDLAATLSSSLDFSDSLQKRQELRAAHIRNATIEDRLAGANDGNTPLDWGYDVIADALELDTAVLDFEVPATKTWIDVAGKELYQGAKEGRDSWALSRKRNMKKEDGKMSLSRWKFWEEGMKEYQERGEVIESAGKGAGEEMKKLKESGR